MDTVTFARTDRILMWHRPGTKLRPDMLNVVSEGVPKGRQGDSPQAPMVATGSRFGRRVAATLISAAAWVDIHILDQAAQLIDSGTYLDETVYEASSLVPPGSVARLAGSEARRLQYRIYLELGDRLFTVGPLHQHDLAQDAVSW